MAPVRVLHASQHKHSQPQQIPATPRVAHCRVSHLRIVRRFARSRKSGASVAAFAISGPPAAQL